MSCFYTLGSFIRSDVIRWEALYVEKHYTLRSFIRSDVKRYDVICSVFICSDIIRSDVIRGVITRSVGESNNYCKHLNSHLLGAPREYVLHGLVPGLN